MRNMFTRRARKRGATSCARHERGATSFRRRPRERGATLVEAAIVTPLFFLLILGVAEAGYAYFANITVDNMSVAGARSGSGEASEPLADYSILQAVKKASVGMPTSKIDMVVVYRATGPTDRVPTTCLTASVTNSTSTRGCNRYVGSDLSRPSTDFGCTGTPAKVDRFWCPTSRNVALSGPPDHIGVYVQARHGNITQVFGPSFTFKTDTVMRIEPRVA
jgi:Flp pilus assembly protein TadG